MIRIAIKPLLFKLLRRVPMPLIAIGIGLATGLVVWTLLDVVQSRQVGKIFSQELNQQLDLREREALVRFEHYLAGYAMTTRLFAHHRKLSAYLEAQPAQDAGAAATARSGPLRQHRRPPWLPEVFEWADLPEPQLVLLTTPEGRVREVYRPGGGSIPQALARHVPGQFFDRQRALARMARFDDRLYLVASDRVESVGGAALGFLLVAVPVDAAFLAASQRGMSPDRAAVALVDVETQRVLASVAPQAIVPGTSLTRWQARYVVTTRSLPTAIDNASDLLFATFISQSSVEKMSRHVRIFERRQRLYAALVFILVFTALIYLVSSRLNKVLKRMTRFARRALDMPGVRFQRGGNQLVLLEDWSQQFTRLVLSAREELKRRHQAELRRSEALKAAMMEASLDAILTIDQAGRIVECNPAATRLLALAREQVLGQFFAARFLAVAQAQEFARLRDAAARAPTRGELRVCLGEAEAFPAELSIAPIELGDERFYTLYVRDLSERKRAEREIGDLARFASESPNPILRVSAEGRLVYANAASRPLLGAWRVTSGDLLPAAWCDEVASALVFGHACEREVSLDGQIFAFLLAPVGELGYVNIYARDITETRCAEAAARAHQAELIHVSRLSTMGEMATGIAHELNQPLAAIVNFANGTARRLRADSVQPEVLLAAMEQITAQARRASEIIRHLRALVGKQAPTRLRRDLNELIREVLPFIEWRRVQLEVEFSLELTCEPLYCEVDPVQIEQVLLNLLGNALDALQAGAPCARCIRVSSVRLDGAAQVLIADSGAGIPPERLRELFRPFATTKKDGMGMGLAISQTIVADHEGAIWAESPSGEGAKFFIRLPLAPDQFTHGSQPSLP